MVSNDNRVISGNCSTNKLSSILFVWIIGILFPRNLHSLGVMHKVMCCLRSVSLLAAQTS